ncbi:MAG: cysteine--tRNA ligase [Prochlorothrix sp.]|nr:cysteine--tRNA ligase [Prochlorothrix sp.]
MALTLYNSLTRRKEPFQPLDPDGQQVKLYCCGVTVYDYCHLGHARSYIIWDTLRRYLLWSGYRVRYVQNFTDIDDKILNRAKTEGTTMEAVSETYTQAYFEDMARLNVLEADEYPRATHTLDGIKRLIHELEQKQYAYAAGGDVYYRVAKFVGYGKLSGRKLEDLQAGASGRVAGDAEAAKKENPFDFALWKGAKPGEPAWESPWGSGRPGWHIECSAMVRDRLGDSIDIHMGGADLTFPHHENEIAQSEAATGHPLARYWLHNGMVNVGGEKMSKSLGNFTTIRDLLDKGGVSPQVLRLFVLQAQYRKPLDFTDEAIESAQNGWQTLTDGLRFGQDWGETLGWSGGDPDASSIDRTSDPIQRFQTALDDDLNTPAALAVLFELAKELRKVSNRLTHEGGIEVDRPQLQRQWHMLVTLAGVLGLEVGEAGTDSSIAADSAPGLRDAEIEALIEARQEARKLKNWAEADRLRDELQAQGITLIDQAGGTRWHR